MIRDTEDAFIPDETTEVVPETIIERANRMATDPDLKTKEGWEWRAACEMPKYASRIKLRITDIRVERVQDISDNDLIEEGMTFGEFEEFTQKHRIKRFESLVKNYQKAKFFNKLNAIYGVNFCNLNPWMWVIEFKVLEAKK